MIYLFLLSPLQYLGVSTQSVLNVVLHFPLRVRNLIVVHRVEIVTLRLALKYQFQRESFIDSDFSVITLESSEK